MAYYLAPISNGLGDLIVSIPILQALIKTGEPTYLVMRSPAQDGLNSRLEGLAGAIKETDFEPDRIASSDTFFNFRAHPLQSDFIWGSKEFEEHYPGYTINDVLKGICKDFGIEVNFEVLKPLKFHRRPELSERIAFIPGSAGLFKCWPSAHWIELAARLSLDGLEVFVIGQPDRCAVVQEILDHGIDHVPTPELVDAIDVLSSSACAIAVDTGLMHAGVHQGVPTVGIFRYNKMFMPRYKHVRSFVGPVCAEACMEREFAGAPNEKLKYPVWEFWEPLTCSLENVSERCMSQITPEMVGDAVRHLYAEQVK